MGEVICSFNLFELCKCGHTLSAGLVENLSFRTPSSSNIWTTLSVVHTARRFPLGAQQRAVTLTIPSLGCVIDCKCFSCILNFSHNFTQFFEEARIINKPDVILSIGHYPQADSVKDAETQRNHFLLTDYVLSSSLPNLYLSYLSRSIEIPIRCWRLLSLSCVEPSPCASHKPSVFCFSCFVFFWKIKIDILQGGKIWKSRDKKWYPRVFRFFIKGEN